jgi:hypothetical protein
LRAFAARRNANSRRDFAEVVVSAISSLPQTIYNRGLRLPPVHCDSLSRTFWRRMPPLPRRRLVDIS